MIEKERMIDSDFGLHCNLKCPTAKMNELNQIVVQIAEIYFCCV